MATYSEKLSDPRWQKKRLKIFDRDKWKCVSCHSETITLDVHHLQYIDGIDPWDYPDDMLATLCRVCHEKELKRNELERHLSITLRMKGFLVSDLLAMSCKIETDEEFTKTLLNVLREFQER